MSDDSESDDSGPDDLASDESEPGCSRRAGSESSTVSMSPDTSRSSDRRGVDVGFEDVATGTG